MAKILKSTSNTLYASSDSTPKLYTEATFPKTVYLNSSSPTICGLPSGHSIALMLDGYTLIASADFNLALLYSGRHWGTDEIGISPEEYRIYIYNLPDNYYDLGWIGLGNGELEALNVRANLDPIGVIIARYNSLPRIEITTASNAGGYY